jgi:DNA-binding Lrp family transcriptional regulator
VSIEEFFGVRVRVVLALLRSGPMTQTALARELKVNARVLKMHLAWLVSNGIVKAYGTLYTIYEPNYDHPITKTLQELLNLNCQQRKK